MSDFIQIEREEASQGQDYFSYLQGFDTSEFQNLFGQGAGDIYRQGKSYLPYLGSKGNAAYAGLTGLEYAGQAYLEYQHFQNSTPSINFGNQFLQISQ